MTVNVCKVINQSTNENSKKATEKISQFRIRYLPIKHSGEFNSLSGTFYVIKACPHCYIYGFAKRKIFIEMLRKYWIEIRPYTFIGFFHYIYLTFFSQLIVPENVRELICHLKINLFVC